jgi:hypothetical protein
MALKTLKTIIFILSTHPMGNFNFSNGNLYFFLLILLGFFFVIVIKKLYSLITKFSRKKGKYVSN